MSRLVSTCTAAVPRAGRRPRHLPAPPTRLHARRGRSSPVRGHPLTRLPTTSSGNVRDRPIHRSARQFAAPGGEVVAAVVEDDCLGLHRGRDRVQEEARRRMVLLPERLVPTRTFTGGRQWRRRHIRSAPGVGVSGPCRHREVPWSGRWRTRSSGERAAAGVYVRGCRRQLERAAAARGVAQHAPAARVGANAVAGLQGVRHIAGEEGLGLRTARHVDALGVGGARWWAAASR